ncbi:hypothetical protein AYI69_g4074 [Smittium culicis]|uniref:Uncharacterized protein n=1 Tax=Smittium culicis TaxID=133412 RepID=A0A1R1YGV1_9FUNG|nr:hypothetical protein AYI69_g4074 [Smittium culicis]
MEIWASRDSSGRDKRRSDQRNRQVQEDAEQAACPEVIEGGGEGVETSAGTGRGAGAQQEAAGSWRGQWNEGVGTSYAEETCGQYEPAC